MTGTPTRCLMRGDRVLPDSRTSLPPKRPASQPLLSRAVAEQKRLLEWGNNRASRRRPSSDASRVAAVVAKRCRRINAPARKKENTASRRRECRRR